MAIRNIITHNIGKFMMLVFLFISCQTKTNDPSELTGFFEELSTNIEKNKLELFTSSKIDSSGLNIDLIYDEVKFELERRGSKELHEFLDSVCQYRFEDEVHYLTVAFHYHLNDRELNNDSIFNDLDKILEYYWNKKHFNNVEEARKITNINNEKYKVGDTLYLCLPVRNGTTFYYGEILPDSLYYVGVDKLSLKGVLLDKYYTSYSINENDTSNLIFDIDILYLSENIDLFGDKKELRDTLSLDVTAFGRVLERESDVNGSVRTL